MNFENLEKKVYEELVAFLKAHKKNYEEFLKSLETEKYTKEDIKNLSIVILVAQTDVFFIKEILDKLSEHNWKLVLSSFDYDIYTNEKDLDKEITKLIRMNFIAKIKKAINI